VTAAATVDQRTPVRVLLRQRPRQVESDGMDARVVISCDGTPGDGSVFRLPERHQRECRSPHESRRHRGHAVLL